MRVLLAPDGMSAGADVLGPPRVAAALAAGWRAARPADDLRLLPLGATGPDLVASLHAVRGGELIAVVVPDPDGADAPATWLRDEAGTAYLDVGAVLGDATGDDAARLAAHGSSAGAGELLAEVVRSGARRVVVGVGPVGVHDAGRGALDALATLLPVGERGGDVPATVRALRARLRDVDLLVAAGTETPLVGLHGAGALLSRRSGIDPAAAQRVEQQVADHVARLDEVLADAGSSLLVSGDQRRGSRRPHSGAGGGLALLLAALGARVLPGAAVVAELTDAGPAVDGVDLVLTGTAVLDGAALADGVPAVVGRHALRTGVPVVALGNEVLISRREIAGTGLTAVYPVRDPAPPGRPAAIAPGGLEEALADRSARVARTWSR